jgi:hypothetical protein
MHVLQAGCASGRVCVLCFDPPLQGGRPVPPGCVDLERLLGYIGHQDLALERRLALVFKTHP